MIKVYKQNYSFATGEAAVSYETFLKQHLFELQPNYYGLTHKRKIKTADGWMYAAHLSIAIEDPNLETVAECWINNQLIYFWRGRCWTLAVDKEEGPIYRFDSPNPTFIIDPLASKIALDYCNKSIVIYPIGTDPI